MSAPVALAWATKYASAEPNKDIKRTGRLPLESASELIRNCETKTAANSAVNKYPVSERVASRDCAYGTSTGDKNCRPIMSTNTQSRHAANALDSGVMPTP